MLMNIQNTTPTPQSPHPIVNLGFRIFFAGAAVFAMIAMLMWLGIFQAAIPFKAAMNPFYWHAHEMIFGYALAVIAGFLLTAVQTWTGQAMPYGMKLLAIFAFWAMARILWMGAHAVANPLMLMLAFVFDMLFWGATSFFIIQAVYRTRQKRQMGIAIKLILFAISHIIFYIGVFSDNVHRQKIGLYLGFYLVLAVVLTIGRRVLPFFIEKGVAVDATGKPNGTVYQSKNSPILDKLSLIGLLGFLLTAVFFPNRWLILLFSLLVAASNIMRLVNWHHQAIWHKPLLWSLYVSFWGLAIGFMLFGVQPFIGFAPSLALHTMALFGIGLTTLAMMARVSLAHTGRNIHTPPKVLMPMLLVFGLSIVFRVILPMLDAAGYLTYVLISQILWTTAFALFCVGYIKILASERIDGSFG